MAEENTRTGGDRPRELILDTFQFLKAFHRLRFREEVDYRRLWNLSLVALPAHDAVTFDPGDAGKFFAVRRPAITEPPQLSAVLAPWITGGIRNPEKEPAVKQPDADEVDGGEEAEQFGDDPERPRLFAEYLVRWRSWAVIERPAREALRLYDKLYDLRTLMQREPDVYDLFVADGVLVWNRGDQIVFHPVLLQRSNVEFDAEANEMSVGLAGSDPEQFPGYIVGADDDAVRAFRDFRDELGQHTDIWPLGSENTDSFFTRLARSTNKGEFSSVPVIEAGEQPRIYRSPMLLLMRRGFGMSEFIDSIIRDLEDGAEHSPCLEPIVGVFRESAASPGDELEDIPADEDESVYFTKPANKEQLRIVQHYRKTGRVVVQGPPGTGKTHTIANLIGHFLAEGKNILVTAETTKALSVIREKVAKPLQPLCLSVVEAGKDEGDLLKTGVAELRRILDDTSPGPKELERQAEDSTHRRRKLIQKLKQHRRELYEARHSEIAPIRISGEELEPSEAAKLVRAGVGQLDWIPGAVDSTSVPPLSDEEIRELYESNLFVSAEDEENHPGTLPEPGKLPDPALVASILAETRDLQAAVESQFTFLKANLAAEGAKETAGSLLASSRAALSEVLAVGEEWRLRLVDLGHQGVSSQWDTMFDMADTIAADSNKTAIERARHGISVEDGLGSSGDFQVLEQIRSHLARGGRLTKLSLLPKKQWRLLLDRIRVGGRPVESEAQMSAAIAELDLRRARVELIRVWKDVAERVGLPSLNGAGLEPEERARKLKNSALTCLRWSKAVWSPLAERLQEFGFDVHKAMDSVPANVVLDGFAAQAVSILQDSAEPELELAAQVARKHELERQLEHLKGELGAVRATCDTPVIRSLESSLAALDGEAYEDGIRRFKDLYEKSNAISKRRSRIKRLRMFAPTLASEIANRAGVHGLGEPPGRLSEAWKWKQLDQELVRRHALDAGKAIRDIRESKKELDSVTGELAKVRAWGHLHSKITGPVRSALGRFQQAAAIVTGKRAPVMRREAKQAMDECSGAVPVWIMPMARVATSIPSTTRFDVIIIDEASQVPVTGLSVLHLAKSVIIVGDEEQVEPVVPGIEVSDEVALQEAWLEDVPGKGHWHSRQSVYGLAKDSGFGKSVCLLEHFRCVPDIISFSSWLSYERNIKPLREDSKVRRRPFVVCEYVPDAELAGKRNRIEAIHIVSLLKACSEQPEYEGTKFGVVSLKFDAKDHAGLIDEVVTRRLGSDWREKHEFRSGVPDTFQGDERTVVFLSTVDVPRSDGSPLRLQTAEANYKFWKKRYNVAASRAQDQLWVVSSLRASDLQPRDIRSTLLDFSTNPKEWRKRAFADNPKAESHFEQVVYQALHDRGYRLTPQYWVGNFRIDMIAECGEKRAAIECDGERHHFDLAKDMERQAILERQDWKFVRIRGSRYYKDPSGAIDEVCEELGKLGVFPVPDEAMEAAPETELLQRVRARAQEIRLEWKREEPSGEDEEPVVMLLEDSSEEFLDVDAAVTS